MAKSLTKRAVRGSIRLKAWQQNNVFETYLLMGLDRTLPKLAQETNIPVTTLRKWNNEFKWEKQIEARTNSAAVVVDAKTEKLKRDMLDEEIKRQHLAYYDEAVEKAVKALRNKKLQFTDAAEAIKSLDIGIKGRREVMGLRDKNARIGIQAGGFAALVEMTNGCADESADS